MSADAGAGDSWAVPRRRENDPELERVASRVLGHARSVLAENVRRRRHAAGKTQERLAEDVGVSAIYVQALERGRDENPTLRVLSLLAHALGCGVGQLLDDAHTDAHTSVRPTSRRSRATKATGASERASRTR